MIVLVPPSTPLSDGEHDHQATALLDAARTLLANEGPAALTVRRIAAESGWSTMGVYSRFGGKAGVVEELWIGGFIELGRRLLDVSRTANPVLDLLGMGHAYRNAALANPTTYGIMFGRAVPDFEPSPRAQSTALDVFGLLVKGVERVLEMGEFSGHDPEEIAFVLWATAHGFASLEMAGYGEQPPLPGMPGTGPRDLFDVACRALLHGLTAG